MTELECRHWTDPDGTRLRVRITETLSNVGAHLRRVRRIEFEGADGEPLGSTVVGGFVCLDLLTSAELVDLWYQAMRR